MSLAKDFLWGGSISAHQCEGAWDKDGKGVGIMDLVTSGSHKVPREICKKIESDKFYPSHTAINFYDNYKDDIALFAEMGFKALRISVDWSRIYPNGDDEYPNKKGIEFYNNVIDELISYNIEPIITLYHFEMPYILVEKYGSWKNRKLIDLYLRYCKVLFEEFNGKVKYWVTFNEMNHIDPSTDASDIFTYIIAGLKFSELKNPKQELAVIGYNMTLAGVKAVELGHRINPDNKIGCVFGLQPVYPYNCKPINAINAFKEMHRDFYQMDAMCNGNFPKYKLKEYEKMGISLDIESEDEYYFKNGTIDFIGVNYYSSSVGHNDEIGGEETLFGGIQNPYLEKSKWGWSIDPTGLRYLLNDVYQRYEKPIIVTENGIGAVDVLNDDNTVDDDYRIEYLEKHLEQLKLAIDEDNIECFGYLMWGPIDLVSATTGEMKKRYGFIYVDINDDGSGSGKRYPKKSFYWFKNVIKSNNIEIK